jgi:hypothetical protein
VRSLNTTRETRTVEAMMIAKDAASALKSLGQKCSEAPCTMYDGKSNPNILLEDYRLACKTGGADDDLFII